MNDILPRSQCPTAASAHGFGHPQIDVDWVRREIRHQGGRCCKLSARETALLACLARKAGTPVSRGEILEQVWKLDPRRTTTRTVDMHVSFLRRKIETAGSSLLVTVHRVGYMLRRSALLSDDASWSTKECTVWGPATAGESSSAAS